MVPPSVEEGHLDDCELVFGIVGKLGHHGVDGVLDSCELGSHVSPVEVVVDCFEPSDVVVGMGDEMDSNTWPVFGVLLIVVLLHHVLIGISQG